MKLTIVPRSHSDLVVPRISEYANSQNKVNAADFFSNHPFHIRVEEFSRRILAPAGHVGYRETKWFYERARGQYADEKGRRTPADRKKFDAEYPRSQFFTKTDLAKVENTFAGKPHIVSLGAQKNFTEFAKSIGKVWGKDGTCFDEIWYRRLIAKVIVFRAMERIVSAASWYGGGYRSNIVAYGVSKVAEDAQKKGMTIDLDSIWRSGRLSSELENILFRAGAEAQDVIVNPPAGIKNFGEWAKKEMCWKWLSERKFDLSFAKSKVFISIETANEHVKQEKFNQLLTGRVQAEIDVHQLGAAFWSEVQLWGIDKMLLTPSEINIIGICAAIPRKMPSEKQCVLALQVLDRLSGKGFKRGAKRK